MSKIYVLQLQKKKYYVGKTDNIERRYEEHIRGIGSSWTAKYQPIKIYKIHESTSSFDEDKYTKMYMNKFGIDNVRGGSYVQENLDDFTKYILQKEIWSSNNCCSRCGRDSHFVSKCYATTDVNGNEIVEFEIEEDEEDDDEDSNECNCCYRCGREGHYANNCYAKYDITGKYIR